MNEQRRNGTGMSSYDRVQLQKKSRKNGVRRTKKKTNTKNRPKRLRQWTDEQMRCAMEAMMKGELGPALKLTACWKRRSARRKRNKKRKIERGKSGSKKKAPMTGREEK